MQEVILDEGLGRVLRGGVGGRCAGRLRGDGVVAVLTGSRAPATDGRTGRHQVSRCLGTGVRAGFGKEVLSRRFVARRASQEHVSEGASEFAADGRVEHEVDGRVDGDEQVTHVVDDDDVVRLRRVDRVHDGRRQLAHEEHDDDDDEHRCDARLFGGTTRATRRRRHALHHGRALT